MSGSRLRVAVPAVVVLVLVALVAIAATGSVAGGSNRTRQPPDVLLDTIFSLLALALVPAAILLVYGFAQRREVSAEYTKRKRRSSGVLIFLLLLLAVAVYFHGLPRPHAPSEPGGFVRGAPPATPVTPASTPPETQYEPRFAWLPVSVILSLVAAAGLAWYLSARRRPRREYDETMTESLVDLLGDTLDDLRAETDPRRAVIAAYARLERVLATQGLGRRPAETPEELLTRALARLEVSSDSIRRLTDLFERAKFSQHDVDVGMKEEAIAALEQVRDELREAAAARRAAAEPVDATHAATGPA